MSLTLLQFFGFIELCSMYPPITVVLQPCGTIMLRPFYLAPPLFMTFRHLCTEITFFWSEYHCLAKGCVCIFI